TMSRLPTNQRELGLSTRTSLDLAVALRPMVPFPELVSSTLLDKTSSVNGPFVPTVTWVKVFVKLLNVLVAPSLTTCAPSGKAPTMVAKARARQDFAEKTKCSAKLRTSWRTGWSARQSDFILLVSHHQGGFFQQNLGFVQVFSRANP